MDFWVNNPAVMPREVQLQVFKRSFSTKGSGRGIGTYSMRLLVSRYLGGSVDFESTGGRWHDLPGSSAERCPRNGQIEALQGADEWGA